MCNNCPAHRIIGRHIQFLSANSAAQKAMSVELAIELEHETFGDYVRRVSIVSVIVITFFVYPTICQAVLNTFACFHIDTGSGQYSELQRVRLPKGCLLVSTLLASGTCSETYTGSHGIWLSRQSLDAADPDRELRAQVLFRT